MQRKHTLNPLEIRDTIIIFVPKLNNETNNEYNLRENQ